MESAALKPELDSLSTSIADMTTSSPDVLSMRPLGRRPISRKAMFCLKSSRIV